MLYTQFDRLEPRVELNSLGNTGSQKSGQGYTWDLRCPVSVG